MKRTALTIIIAVACCTAHAITVDYQRADSLKVMSLLTKAQKQKKGSNIILYLARQLKGLPYVAKTLENNKEEKLVVNLRQLDCTTYVETVAALYLCIKNGTNTFKDYCHYLQQLRYKNGVVSYPARLHYYSLWIDDNTRKGFVTEVQKPNPPFCGRQTINVDYMTTHVSQYPMLADNKAWVREIADMEKSLNGKTVRYIPSAAIKNTQLMRNTVHNGDIIALVTKKKGLDTSHLGIAVWHKDGLHLLNASMLRKVVVEEPMTLRQYMFKHTSNLGLRIIRMR